MKKALSLDDVLFGRITTLSDEGNSLLEEGRFDEAVEKYRTALKLLPEPITHWAASTWLLTSIGDALFLKGDFEASREALQGAMHCPDAVGNPFLHLRLGQAQLELGNEDRARDELARAYMGGGDEIFERDDPKYLEWIKRFLSPAVKPS